jgi:hypothetical protein
LLTVELLSGFVADRPKTSPVSRRIVGVKLPKLGSLLDIAMCSPLSGYAQSRPSWISERTRDVVLGLSERCEEEMAARERALADLAAAHETAKERGEAMLRRWGF